MGEIVRAFKPSDNLKDWGCRSDGDGNWFYEQYVRFYCTGCKTLRAFCQFISHVSERNVGKEPYYDLIAKKIVPAPRIYITHHPKKGEWEHLKTVADLKASPLYREGNS